MNILHVIPGLTWERGGPTAVVCALARHQAAAGHRVHVLGTDQGARHGERPADFADSVTVERLKVWGTDRIAYAPGFARAVRARLRDSDVVHVHSIFTYPVHAALKAALSLGVPTVLRPCGLLHHYSLRISRLRKRAYLALWGRRVRRACTAWHFTSEQEAGASWPGDDSSRFVVPNGVEPAEFTLDRDAARQATWQRLPALRRAPYVLFLGRVHAKKRLDVLLEAFLASAPEPYKLVVAGPDSDGLWDSLRQRWLHGAFAERVVRAGMVTGRQKTELLAGATLFALPSEHENFGVAALESLAAGTPVLLSPHVDLASAAVAAAVGRAAPVDVRSWQDSLAEMLRDSDQLGAMGDRAGRWVVDHYSWDRIAAEVVRRYRWVMNGCPREWPSLTAQPTPAGAF